MWRDGLGAEWRRATFCLAVSADIFPCRRLAHLTALAVAAWHARLGLVKLRLQSLKKSTHPHSVTAVK